MALVLTNADILSTLELLADGIFRAESGTTTSLVCSALANNILNVDGYVLVFMSSDLYSKETTVSNYDINTNTITLTDTQTGAVTKSTKFALLETSYYNFMTRAEDIMTDIFRNKGLDITLFLTTAQLKELHIYKTIELICRSKMNGALDEDVYFAQTEYFSNIFDSALSNLKADYDANEDGTISEDEENMRITTITLVR